MDTVWIASRPRWDKYQMTYNVSYLWQAVFNIQLQLRVIKARAIKAGD